MSVSAGGNTSFIIDNNESVYVWGDNFLGQIGNGTKEEKNSTPTEIKELTNL